MLGQSTMFVLLMSHNLVQSAHERKANRLAYSRCPANTNNLATPLGPADLSTYIQAMCIQVSVFSPLGVQLTSKKKRKKKTVLSICSLHLLSLTSLCKLFSMFFGELSFVLLPLLVETRHVASIMEHVTDKMKSAARIVSH